MIEYFKIEGGSVVLACDNLGAITSTAYGPAGTNPAACTHFDFVMAIQKMKSGKIVWHHKHVDGHMDDVRDHVLTPLEVLNTEMDAKAKAFWQITCDSTRPRIQYFDDEPWSITVGDEKIVTQLSHTLHDWCQRPRIQAYWTDKSRFPAAELVHIDYATAGHALQSASIKERREVTKHSVQVEEADFVSVSSL
jgi:hypothetical protein